MGTSERVSFDTNPRSERPLSLSWNRKICRNPMVRRYADWYQASNAALHTLHLHDRPATFPIQITRPHLYALYTQHHPSEFQIELRDARGVLAPALTHEYKPKHEHNNAVTSVGSETPGELDPKKLNAWLSNLLRTQGPDIFRMKGILSIKGEDKRFVFQGVHMLFDGRPDCS